MAALGQVLDHGETLPRVADVRLGASSPRSSHAAPAEFPLLADLPEVRRARVANADNGVRRRPLARERPVGAARGRVGERRLLDLVRGRRPPPCSAHASPR